MESQQIVAPGGGKPNEDAGAGQAQINNPGIDQLLDQIDAVLESDAQAFVDGFVQKGGQ